MDPVLVEGGGIGGLTAALAKARVGLPFRVLEAAPERGEIGSGLTLWCNAVAILRDLGLDDAVL